MDDNCCDIWKKFDFAEGEVLTTAHWRVAIRPKQVTLGALVLACKRRTLGIGDLLAAEAADLAVAAAALERRLGAAFQHDKINYLALMMHDPHLHFHVLPRYAQPRTVDGYDFVDSAWGGPPRLDVDGPPTPVVASVLAALRRTS